MRSDDAEAFLREIADPNAEPQVLPIIPAAGSFSTDRGPSMRPWPSLTRSSRRWRSPAAIRPRAPTIDLSDQGNGMTEAIAAMEDDHCR